MAYSLLIILFTVFCNLSCIDPDNLRNSVQLIESRGFGSETHQVFTRDGYILTVFRVINPYQKESHKKPIIVWHGITHDSKSWLISTDGILRSDGLYSENNNLVNDCNLTITSNLPLTLASCGYDVWLPNTRGTEYSKEHQLYDADKDPAYWEYSLTELGVYDARAVVEYVLNNTKQESVGYIGFSMGSTLMFILLSLEPKFETFIKPFIALAPFVYMSHMRSTLRAVANYEPNLRSKAEPLGIPKAIAQFLGIFICGNQYLNPICADLLFYAAGGGYDPDNLNTTRIPIYTSHNGATYSTWVYAHLAQLINSGTFSGFNYGNTTNLDIYGQDTPPSYPLSRITCRNIAIFYGRNDIVANITDVQTLIRELHVPLLDNYLVPYPNWAHQNFQWGIHQGVYVNARVLGLLKSVYQIK